MSSSPSADGPYEGGIITIDVTAEEPPAEEGPAARAWGAIEQGLVRLGDRLNPILVKETRQALKSRQFLLTFGLLLFFGWGWSILGTAIGGPGTARGAFGQQMFVGYFVILSFPLLVVVPFGAYRSLAAEQESRTFELLSITALGTRQIVAGKLGSALLQMSIYLSAISPCLAFTYLLRGIDFLTILVFLVGVALASLGASAIGLLLASLPPQRQFQVFSTVGAVLGFGYVFVMSIVASVVFFDEGGETLLADWEFWVAVAAVLTAFAAYFVMVCEAAAARLSFASDNRSTRLRVIMVVQYVLLAGWMAVLWALYPRDPTVIMVFMLLAGLHWYAMGALLIGQSPYLSERVKRRLPQSFLGRMFLTWFYPGPGTGYALTISGLVGTLLAGGAAAIAGEWSGAWRAGWWTSSPSAIVFTFGVLGLSYVMVYLGLGLLVLRAARRVAPSGLLLSVLVQALLLLVGCVVPLVIQLSSPLLRNSSYSLLHVTNPLWTLLMVGSGRSLPPQTPILLVLVPLAAAAVFVLNLPGLCREVRNVRIAVPRRVAEEDAQQAALRRPPPPPKPQHPWDH